MPIASVSQTVFVATCDFCGATIARALEERSLELGAHWLGFWDRHPHDGKLCCSACYKARKFDHPDVPLAPGPFAQMKIWSAESDFASPRDGGFAIPGKPPDARAHFWGSHVLALPLSGTSPKRALLCRRYCDYVIPVSSTHMAWPSLAKRAVALLSRTEQTPWPYVQEIVRSRVIGEERVLEDYGCGWSKRSDVRRGVVELDLATPTDLIR